MMPSPNKLDAPLLPPGQADRGEDVGPERLARGLGLTRETGAGYYRRSLSHYKDGDTETAIIDVSEAIHYDRGYAEYYAVRGLFYTIQLTLENRPTEDNARQDLYYALRLNKRTWLAHYALGLIEFRAQSYEAALDRFTQALNIKPKRSETLLYRAVTLYQLNDLDRALEDIERALIYLPATDKRKKDLQAWQKEIRAGLGKDKKEVPSKEGKSTRDNERVPARETVKDTITDPGNDVAKANRTL